MIKDIAELEWIMGKLIGVFPRQINRWMVRQISLRDFLVGGSILEIRPHDPKDNKIPDSLKKYIYTHLMERGATCHSVPNHSHTYVHF